MSCHGFGVADRSDPSGSPAGETQGGTARMRRHEEGEKATTRSQDLRRGTPARPPNIMSEDEMGRSRHALTVTLTCNVCWPL